MHVLDALERWFLHCVKDRADVQRPIHYLVACVERLTIVDVLHLVVCSQPDLKHRLRTESAKPALA